MGKLKFKILTAGQIVVHCHIRLCATGVSSHDQSLLLVHAPGKDVNSGLYIKLNCMGLQVDMISYGAPTFRHWFPSKDSRLAFC